MIKLAFRNITHACKRTWLNVAALAFTFIIIIWTQGMYDGMSSQVKDAAIKYEIGGGQYWSVRYDPFDPFKIEDSYQTLPWDLYEQVEKGMLTPVLITTGTIFPGGRIFNATLRGIKTDQKILEFPSSVLHSENDEVTALIGKRMANATGLNKGDYVTMKWRNSHGTYDAIDIKIVEIMETNIQAIDAGQLWLSYDNLERLLRTQNAATLLVAKEGYNQIISDPENWIFRDHDFLLKDINSFISRKKVSSGIMFFLLLGMAMLAIFDTQVLSIFRRRREIGTMIALGLNRLQVIILFTIEGAMHGILGITAGILFGTPLFIYSSINGFDMPQATDQVGLSLGSSIMPNYGFWLFLFSSILVFVAVTIVSLLPTRKIARLNPTDALRRQTI